MSGNTKEADDIVISGMSGRFPESDNVEELAKNLYAGVDLITEDDRRWPPGVFGLPKGSGKIKNLSHFDADFFGVPGNQAQLMDPQIRLLVEVAYETIIDAGININEFRGSNTGVYVATSAADARELTNDVMKLQGYELTGCSPSFFANRVCHAFDLKGPSFLVDNGCASSLTALVQAMVAIKAGQCDAAIVASTNLSLSPSVSLSLFKMHAASIDSRCKSFSARANGYVRSEAVTAVLIQKRSRAKRIYATIRGGRINTDGYKLEGFSFPSKEMHRKLTEDTLKEAGLRPQDITYFEAHGTATKVGDSQELNGIADVFCKGRNKPLLIGSVKSNIGHTEAASGLNSLVKVLLTMERGVIPGNLHFDLPNPDVPALIDGRLKVVDTNTPWEGGLISLNSFGFGGSNSHVIVESNPVSRPLDFKYSLPRLVVASGRTLSAVNTLLEHAKIHSEDAELHALLEAVHASNIPGHKYRGYAVLGETPIIEFSELQITERPPTWFVFTSCDTDWIGMDHKLMEISPFAKSISQLATTLQPLGIDLLHILKKDLIKEDLLNKTIALVALHIAFVDLLREINIKPDGFIAYSVGEIGCRYAEGNLTAEQAILCAYWCGRSLMNNVSKAEINQDLKRLLPNFKHGSMDDAEVFLNNIKSSKLTIDLVQTVPHTAVVIEIGPKELNNNDFLNQMPAIGVSHVTLWNPKTEKFNIYAAIGKLYNAGLQPLISSLYPAVKWPVSRGTPGLSSQIEWDHTREWHVPHYSDMNQTRSNMVECDLAKPDFSFISGYNIRDKILFPASGYLNLVWKTIKNLQRKSVEDSLIIFENVHFKKFLNFSSNDVIKFEISVLPITGGFEICNNDDVLVTGTIRLDSNTDTENKMCHISEPITEKYLIPLTNDDIYKELKLRGYFYSGLFQGIQSADPLLKSGTICWKENWISFIDTMFQFNVLDKNTRDLYLPSYVQRIAINPRAHLADAANNKNIIRIQNQGLNKITTRGVEIRGVKWSLENHSQNDQPTLEKFIFMPYDTVNGISNLTVSENDILTVNLQIMLENAGVMRLKIVEVAINENVKASILPRLLQILESEPQVQVEPVFVSQYINQVIVNALKEYNVKVSQNDDNFRISESNCNLIVADNILPAPDALPLLQEFASALSDTGMILLMESSKSINDSRLEMLKKAGLTVISRQERENVEYILLRRSLELPEHPIIIEVSEDDNYHWVDTLREAIKRIEDEDCRIYLVSRFYNSGLLGLCACLRTEADGCKVKAYLIPDARDEFSLDNPAYKEQAEKDLAVNVLRNEMWGSYRHLMLNDKDGAPKNDHYTSGDMSCGVRKTTSDEDICQVYYASLNYHKLTNENSEMSINSYVDRHNIKLQENVIGLEFSGKNATGEYVMGLAKSEQLATEVLVEKNFLWKVPNYCTLEEASTIPLAYSVAYYALLIKAQVNSARSILIHKGTTDIAQAAIAIALEKGCKVFTTADDENEKKILLMKFPKLLKTFIGDSTMERSFEQIVRQHTEQLGVNVVLNLGNYEHISALSRCLRHGGQFLQLGKLDGDSNLDLSEFTGKIFHSISMDSISREEKILISNMIKEGIDSRVVRPLPAKTFSYEQIEESVKCAMKCSQMEKILIQIRNKDEDNVFVKDIPSKTRIFMDPHKSYVVIGGLGGIGLEFAQWLISRGANNLVFNSRSGVKTGYQCWRLRRWQEMKVNVEVSTDDAATEQGAKKLIGRALGLAPVGGIFNIAGLLQGAVMKNQSPEMFMNVGRSKIDVTKMLDAVSRTMCSHLDHFVVFSSLASGRGYYGLTNYGFANSAMERMMEQRRADGLAGLAIQWGPVGKVGILKDMAEEEIIMMSGTLPLSITSCMESLDTLLVQPFAVVSCFGLAEKNKKNKRVRINICRQIADVFGITDIAAVNQTATLQKLGMDSIMAAEVQAALRRYDIVFTIDEIISLTFAKLQSLEGDTDDNSNL